jgi:hypothetical protein
VSKCDLKIDWATHEAAKYACENWHYSKTLPVGKMVKIGVWENNKFIGVLLFAWGMNKSLGSPYGLQIGECCELVRIALTKHQTPVSRMISLSLKWLKKQSQGLRLIVSFSDPAEGHYGGIYQATNWIYAGESAPNFEWRLNGKRLNKRAYTGNQFGKAGSRASIPIGAVRFTLPGKHRYLMPLDTAMRVKILPLARRYPKRAGSDTTDTAGFQPAEGGSIPTPALHLQTA